MNTYEWFKHLKLLVINVKFMIIVELSNNLLDASYAKPHPYQSI